MRGRSWRVQRPAVLHDALHSWRVAKATVGGKRRTQAASPAARGHCPHPRAQGALALSLDRERDLERRESEKERARAGRVTRPLPYPARGLSGTMMLSIR